MVAHRPGPAAGSSVFDLPAGCASLTELFTTGDGRSRAGVRPGNPPRAVVEHAPHESRVFRCGP